MRKEKRKRQEKKRFWTLFVLLGMLLPYFQMMGSAFPQKVTAETGENVLINKKDVLLASSGYQKQDQKVQWTIHYEKKASTTPRKLQFKIQVGEATIPVESLEANLQAKFTSIENGWLAEKEFGNTTDVGDIRFVTNTTEKPQVYLQMLEENVETTASSGETAPTQSAVTTTTLLTNAEIGPYNLQMSENVVDGNSAATSEKPTHEDATKESATGISSNSSAATATESSKSGNSAGTTVTVPKVDRRTMAKSGMVTQVSSWDSLVPQYTAVTDENGVKPKDGYSWTNGENVTNHLGYGNTGNGWNNGSNNDNYINYGTDLSNPDFAIKKYAKEVSQGLFDVTLAVKGNELTDIQPVDIMLVIDWSGSMNETMDNGRTRVQEVKKGIESFINTLDKSAIKDKISLGYVGYSSEGGDRNGSYSNNTIPLKKFDDILKRDILNFTPSETSGGTFTQKALREAGEQLTDPSHRRVIVLMTDGVPTFSYKVTSAYKDSDNQIIGTKFSNEKDEPGNTSKLDDSYTIGKRPNRFEIKDTFSATIGEAMLVKEKGIEIHGLGIQLQNDGRYLTQDQVKAKFKKMVSISSDGQTLYYEDADEASQISDYLTKKAIEITGTVANGSIVDPIGDQYNLVSDLSKIKITPSSSEVTIPHISIDGKTISASNISLTKDQEVKITYQIRIKTEVTDFKPDYWYPMNGDTTFKPTPDSPSYPFGVPSGKAPGVELNIKKNWVGDDTTVRPDSLNFNVSRSDVTSGWENATVTLNKSDYDTDSTWNKTNIDQVTAEGKSVYLPKFNNEGNDFTYTVTEDTGSLDGKGYISAGGATDDTNLNYEFTNKMVSLEIRKVDGGNDPLENVTFTLTKPNNGETETFITNKDGKFLMKNLAAGDYTLTETPPAGYEVKVKDYHFTVNKNGIITGSDDLTLQEDADSGSRYGIIVNEQKPAEIIINKIDASSRLPLEGVTFTLTADGYTKELTTNSDGQITFANLDWKKTYKLVESKPLDGYVSFETEITFNFDLKSGTWEITPAENDKFTIDKNEDYSATLTVKNQPITKLPETGGNSRMLLFISGLTVTTISSVALYLSYKKNQGLS